MSGQMQSSVVIRSGVQDYIKRSVLFCLKNQRILACFLLLIFVSLKVLIFYFKSSPTVFWEVDTSLFLRYAHDPEFFHYTSPAIAKAIEGSPSFTKEIAFYLNSIGFTYKENFVFIYIGSVIISTFCVYLAAFNILRALGMSMLVAFFFSVVILNSWFVIDYSRLHPLNTVMTNGGFSMLANALFLLSISFHVCGRTVLASAIILLAATIHPVIGLVGSGFILGSLVIWQLLDKKRLQLNGAYLAALTAVAFVLTLYLSRMDASLVFSTETFDKDLFFSYVYFRSSNPMPLRDGLQTMLVHLFVFGTALFIIRAIHSKSNYAVVILSALCLFWCMCWFAQIIFGEVLQSISLVRLVLNRTSPMLFLISGCLVATLVWHSLQRKQYMSFALLSILCIIFSYSNTLFDNVTVFDYQQANIIFWLGMISVLAFYETGFSLRKTYARFYAGSIVLMLAILYFGLGAKLKNIFDDNDILPVLSVIVLAYGVNLGIQMYSRVRFDFLQNGQLMGGVTLILICIFALKLAYNYQISSKLDRDPTQLYSRYDLLSIIENKTPRDAVIYTTANTDLNGIRKPFFDWVYGWYNLYSLEETRNITRKLALLGIDVRNDPLAYSRCGVYRWLFRPRCHRTLGNVDSRLSEFDWRKNWRILKSEEPKLAYAIVSTKKLRHDDVIIGQTKSFALVRPAEDYKK